MSTLTELMNTQLKTAHAHMVLSEAVCLMRDERIGSLLIEKNGELVGIVSETDIVRKALAEKKDLEVTTLESIMTTPIHGIESYQSAHDAQDMMGDYGIRHLVVWEAGKIVGIISVRDLLVYFQSFSEPKIGQD